MYSNTLHISPNLARGSWNLTFFHKLAAFLFSFSEEVAYKRCFFQTLYFNWKLHCVKSIRIRSYSGPYFPTFGMNTDAFYTALRLYCPLIQCYPIEFVSVLLHDCRWEIYVPCTHLVGLQLNLLCQCCQMTIILQ